jgi:hypothetical protein
MTPRLIEIDGKLYPWSEIVALRRAHDRGKSEYVHDGLQFNSLSGGACARGSLCFLGESARIVWGPC